MTAQEIKEAFRKALEGYEGELSEDGWTFTATPTITRDYGFAKESKRVDLRIWIDKGEKYWSLSCDPKQIEFIDGSSSPFETIEELQGQIAERAKHYQLRPKKVDKRKEYEQLSLF